MKHIVIYESDRTLMDRRTLAMLSGRSVHTIRAKCPVVTHRRGRALYDMEQCAAILETVETRRARTASAPA